jgi:uncharacterized protein YuzE
MKATYDPEADAMYVYLRGPSITVARTAVLEDGRMVDFDEAGKPLGVEILEVKHRGVHLLDLVERFDLFGIQGDLERLERMPLDEIAAG